MELSSIQNCTSIEAIYIGIYNIYTSSHDVNNTYKKYVNYSVQENKLNRTI